MNRLGIPDRLGISRELPEEVRNEIAMAMAEKIFKKLPPDVKEENNLLQRLENELTPFVLDQIVTAYEIYQQQQKDAQNQKELLETQRKEAREKERDEQKKAIIGKNAYFDFNFDEVVKETFKNLSGKDDLRDITEEFEEFDLMIFLNTLYYKVKLEDEHYREVSNESHIPTLQELAEKEIRRPINDTYFKDEETKRTLNDSLSSINRPKYSIEDIIIRYKEITIKHIIKTLTEIRKTKKDRMYGVRYELVPSIIYFERNEGKFQLIAQLKEPQETINKHNPYFKTVVCENIENGNFVENRMLINIQRFAQDVYEAIHYEDFVGGKRKSKNNRKSLKKRNTKKRNKKNRNTKKRK
tara:strand:+ start:848 stop:1912 length:1065 start_codon:yes stop_codon:yes gene_type:complete